MHIRLPRWLARFNRVGTNRLMGVWAPYLPPWAVVAHRGRRTGRAYRTVIFAFRRRRVLVVALTYGETDWQRNIIAAGTAQLTRLGRTLTVADPRLISAGEAASLPFGTRWTARIFGLALVVNIVDIAD